MSIIVVKKQIKKVFLILCLVVISIHANAQKFSGTKLYLKPSKDSVVLRWQVYDSKLWDSQLKQGFDVYRKSSDGTISKLNDSLIKALNPEQFALHYLTMPVISDTAKYIKDNPNPTLDMANIYKPDTIAQKAMALLFMKELGAEFPIEPEDGENSYSNDPVAMRCLFHSIICLTHKEAAITAGLYFIDKKVKPAETYTYYITAANAGMNGVLTTATVNTASTYKLKKPVIDKGYQSRKQVIIAWKKTDTLNQFIPSYEIYRSEQKNSGYKKVTTDPVLALYSGPSIGDTTIVSSTDTTIQKNKIYYYKVRALDVFGGYSEFSEPYMFILKPPLEYDPRITKTTKSISPLQVTLEWEIEKKEEENIASISVYKSNKPDTLFVPVTEKLKVTDRKFIDKTPTKNNYYKLLVIGKAGDSLWSFPSYILISDSIPPAAPVIKSAICDSLGRVTIIWSHNKEIDLYGFIIYKGNYKNEEFSRIKNLQTVDTMYIDTISLRVMDDAVYYELVALDDSYNRSPSSNIMKAKRYDTIIPTSAVFRTFKSNKEGILLEWGNSSSSDVVKTTLHRRLKGELSWHAHKVFARDTSIYTTYRDTGLVKGQWYEYKLQTTDDDKLVSEFSNTLTIKAYDDGIRPPITSLEVKANTRKGIVKITWKYGYAGIKNFQVFRGENDKKPIILKSLNANVFEFYDQSLAPGATYTYIIKAEYTDGGESPFSKPVIVKMK